jgi:serine/threonine protein kinase/Tol biopolymer transport system component
MPLAAGTRLGPYKIIGAIGAGGMGEVYRAEDTRLERAVAIKILPEHLSRDPERRQRFEREARIISTLSHSHICTLHDIGTQDGLEYIVMELLEGETLAHRLQRGPLPLDQVLRYGMEIADALEAAHRQGRGIIHRDLKPVNIMLTKSGAKLLDFGLATYTIQPVHQAATSSLATEDYNKITDQAVIVGTFQYMAPEQIEGKELDARTDIFALGAVLYEMLTGKPAFSGKTRASLIASIIGSDPQPATQLQPLTPPALDYLIRRCLAKDPEERWQTAHDIKLQLKWISEASSQAGVPLPIVNRRKWRERAAWAAVAVLAAAAIALGVGYVRRAPTPATPVAFQLEVPPGYHPIDRTGFPLPAIAVSPDGNAIVFEAFNSKDIPVLLYRSLESTQSRALPDTEGVVTFPWPFWSRDNRYVYFRKGESFYRASPTAGGAERLCDFEGFPMDVNEDGTALVTTWGKTGVRSLNVADCSNPRQVVPADLQTTNGSADHSGRFLPDGKHFLFTRRHLNKRHEIHLGSLDSEQRTVLIKNAAHGEYVEPGFILFSREGFLMGQAFDPKSLRISGDAFSVTPNQLTHAALGGGAVFDVSTNGVLAFREQSDPESTIQVWTRNGTVKRSLGDLGKWGLPRLSPDGTKLFAQRFDSRNHTSDGWILDIHSGQWTRQTFRNGIGETPGVWSPDSQRIVYTLWTTRNESYLKKIGTAGEDEKLTFSALEANCWVEDWSRDERDLILFCEASAQGVSANGIYGFSFKDRNLALITKTATDDEPCARLSADARWLAYAEDRSGESEVYVQAYPTGARHQVSANGGSCPTWSRNGKALYYRAPNGDLMSVAVSPGQTWTPSVPVKLFHLPEPAQFDAGTDGDFIVVAPTGQTVTPISVVVNWRPPEKKN